MTDLSQLKTSEQAVFMGGWGGGGKQEKEFQSNFKNWNN